MKKTIEDFTELKEVSNDTMLLGSPVKRAHDVKIGVNSLIKTSEAAQIPIFIAYYVPGKGYVYDGMLPEELNSPDLKEQYGKFWRFLQLCLDFNKEDYKPVIKSNDDDC